jgi:hypothetical protein
MEKGKRKMINREKVVKDLEFCVNGHFKVELSLAIKILALLKESVSQSIVDQIRWERDTALSQLEEIGKGLGERMDDIVAMLKEQEAVVPKCKERMGGFVAGLCPTCGTALNNVLNVKACGKCGQAVKWE